ncbi:MAG: CoA-binding protein [Bacteroidetes bacterium]|nr:CoA-binding protein [Bacteroidota bacterium]
MPETPDLTACLRDAKTIAVVGCSGRAARTSHRIAAYLQEAGYRVIPVNPNYDTILGEPCYPDLPSVPEDVRIDIVDIFRAPAYTADMVRSAVDRVEQTGERPVIWTQLGVSSEEAERLADEAGLPYVHNTCILVEHRRRIR